MLRWCCPAEGAELSRPSKRLTFSLPRPAVCLRGGSAYRPSLNEDNTKQLRINLSAMWEGSSVTSELKQSSPISPLLLRNIKHRLLRRTKVGWRQRAPTFRDSTSTLPGKSNPGRPTGGLGRTQAFIFSSNRRVVMLSSAKPWRHTHPSLRRDGRPPQPVVATQQKAQETADS